MIHNASHGPAHMQSVSPDFFADIPNHEPQRELSYSMHRQKLHTSLRIPANNRWVADWLFLNIEGPFHPNVTVPPEAFENSLSIDVLHQFFDVQIPTCPFKQMLGGSSSSAPSSLFHSKGADMLFLPVASVDGITVGYAFGSVRNDSPSQIRNDAFAGRFVFEAAREELLVISNGDQPGIPEHVDKLLVIMSFIWTPEGAREHYMMLCPLREYTYYNLPNEVIFYASAEKRVPSKSPVSADSVPSESLFVDSSSPDIIEELINSSSPTEPSPISSTLSHSELADLFELPSASSEFPWFLDISGQTADNVGIPRRPGDVPTSSGAFNMTNLSKSLEAIELSLQGDFYGSRQDMAASHPRGVQDPLKASVMAVARNVVARISRSHASRSASLRQLSVTKYLSAVLPVLSNNRFMIQSEQNGITAAVDRASSQLLPKSTQVRRIAPLPIVSSSCTAKESSNPEEEEARRKEEKREAKRRRNRLSAARSNAKRKEAREMQQRTLESLRDRVRELKAHKMALAIENELLREQMTAGFE